MIFPFIEDYIEFLAGYRNAKNTPLSIWNLNQVIQLANYDTSFVNSVAEQTMTLHTPMSDRQAGLAEKLIEKYERQLRKFQVEQPDHKNYRLGVRAIDRSSGLSLAEGKLHFKFAFDNALITKIKSFSRESHGAVMWDKELRVWTLALTEYNLSWVFATAQANNVSISAEVRELFDLILEAEKTPYAIELRVKDGQCYITNAPDSMVEYINARCGFSDLLGLLDLSGSMGFTVSEDILNAVSSKYGPKFIKLCSGQSIEFEPNKYDVTDIISWAKAVNRFPMCVVNPNLAKLDLDIFKDHFEESEIYCVPNNIDLHAPLELPPGVKLVYSTKVLPTWQGRIPLLVSLANLMHGTAKRSFLQLADKVVYYCSALPR